MRYAQNLAEYEQGIADGIIDENVFVIVLEEKVAKFKGQTFDWSGGGSDVTVDSEMSDTSENPVQNKVIKEYVDSLQDEVIENEEVAAAALVDLDDRTTYLEEVIYTQEQVNAIVAAVEEKYTKIIEENEEVAAAALVDLDRRIEDNAQPDTPSEPEVVVQQNYPVVVISGTSQAMEPNTYYKFSGSALTVTFATPTDNAIVNEYVIEVVANNTTLALPTTIKWAGGESPAMTSGKTYVISVINNLAVFAEF